MLWQRHLCGEVFWVRRRLVFNYVPPTPGTVGAADTVMSSTEQVLTSWRLPAGAETDKSQLDSDWRCEVNERWGELWPGRLLRGVTKSKKEASHRKCVCRNWAKPKEQEMQEPDSGTRLVLFKMSRKASMAGTEQTKGRRVEELVWGNRIKNEVFF